MLTHATADRGELTERQTAEIVDFFTRKRIPFMVLPVQSHNSEPIKTRPELGGFLPEDRWQVGKYEY